MDDSTLESPAKRIVSEALQRVDECRTHLGHLAKETRGEYDRTVSELQNLDDPRADEDSLGALRKSQLLHRSAGEFDTALARLGDALAYVGGAADVLEGRTVRILRPGELLETSLEAAAIQAQEEERYRLAREIHDGPAQILANLALQLEYISKLAEKDPARARDELAIIQRDLRIAVGEVRRFMYDLRPPALSQHGVRAAVESHCQRLVERFGLAITVRWQALTPIPPPTDTAVFRIVQEALQNVVKHAQAQHVEVQAVERDGLLRVSIVDDGRGFDPKRVQHLDPNHFGLAGMKARAQQVGATLEVDSTPGQGAAVLLHVPLSQ